MLPRLRRPSSVQVQAELATLARLPLTYWERGGTDWARMPHGYQHAIERIELGAGEAIWAFAKTAVQDWSFYPNENWIKLDVDGPPKLGQQVMVHFRLLGLWWRSPCRVVYLIDEPNRFGFAYGTLPGHVERGEELFLVSRDPDSGKVSYEIRVMARAQHPIAKLLPGLVKYMQVRFRKTAFSRMQSLFPANLPLLESQKQAIPLPRKPQLKVA